MVNVTWFEARGYAKWAGKRLPTEAEWEKAAKGSVNRIFPWGNTFEPTYCNTRETGLNGTAAVGKYPGGISPYGCLDMAGNVFEWTEDWYLPYAGSEDNSPLFGETYKVIRGGSWDKSSRMARCANRMVSKPERFAQNIGFRCARTPEDLQKSEN